MAECLPDIKILKIIGEGRYGSVYLVEHSKWGEIVLKKLLNSTYKLDKRDLSVLQSEMEVLISVRGPNLVAFYDVQFDPGFYGLLFEHVKYGSVDDFLKIYTVTQAWKMQIIFEIASAMTHLHEDLKMLHGNLKCQNILIGDKFQAKVSDFGLSRIHKIMSNPASGTPSPPREAPGHIAPECFRNPYRPKTTGCDVYSYAIVVWEIFLQILVYDNFNDSSVIDFVLKKGRPEIPVNDDIMPATVKKMIQDCWRHVPKSRPSFVRIRDSLEGQISSIRSEIDGSFMMLREQVQRITQQSRGTLTTGSAYLTKTRTVDTLDPDLIRTLQFDNEVRGIAVASREVFVVCGGTSMVQVFDAQTFEPGTAILIEGMKNPWSIAATDDRVFVFGLDSKRIHRVDLPDKVLRFSWSVDGVYDELFITKQGNLLVTCVLPFFAKKREKICEYTPDGELLKEILLTPEIEGMLQAVPLDPGRFLIIHKDAGSRRLSSVDVRGNTIQGYGEASEVGLPEDPRYLAVDQHGCVLVACYEGRRVVLLSPELQFIQDVIPQSANLSGIDGICFHEYSKRLYVISNKHTVSIFQLE